MLLETAINILKGYCANNWNKMPRDKNGNYLVTPCGACRLKEHCDIPIYDWENIKEFKES